MRDAFLDGSTPDGRKSARRLQPENVGRLVEWNYGAFEQPNVRVVLVRLEQTIHHGIFTMYGQGHL